MDAPVISIVVPVYKAEPYLRGCLDSIIGQTYQNLQIILVDDGSPDGCGAICDEYAEKDGRILVIHKENGGVSSARNAGLEAAKGEWIGFVDADDRLEADMYEYLFGRAREHDADMVQCGFFQDEPAGTERMYCASVETVLAGSGESFCKAGWDSISSNIWNKLYSASVLKGIFFDPSYFMGEDLLFNLRVLLRGVRKFVLGTEAKYHYVQHESSICHMVPNRASVRNHRAALQNAVDLCSRQSAAYCWFRAEQLRIDMHICSRIVQFSNGELLEIQEEIRADLRKDFCGILKLPGVTWKEKMKLTLIVQSWWLYRILLLLSKKL